MAQGTLTDPRQSQVKIAAKSSPGPGRAAVSAFHRATNPMWQDAIRARFAIEPSSCLTFVGASALLSPSAPMGLFLQRATALCSPLMPKLAVFSFPLLALASDTIVKQSAPGTNKLKQCYYARYATVLALPN